MCETGQTKMDWINERLAEGMRVWIQTTYKSSYVTAKVADAWSERGGFFRVDNDGSLYMRRGQKKWDCIDYCKLTAD